MYSSVVEPDSAIISAPGSIPVVQSLSCLHSLPILAQLVEHSYLTTHDDLVFFVMSETFHTWNHGKMGIY